MLLLKNVTFIEELCNTKEKVGDILISDGKIVEIGKNLSSNAEIIDCSGLYACPGFIDLHTHLCLSGGDTLYDNFKNEFYMAHETYKHALDTLKAGFTTIRDVGSNYAMVNGLRDAIKDLDLIAPTIISSGRIITPTESGNNYFPQMYLASDGCNQAFANVRKELEGGADFIKVMASGAIMNPGGSPGSPIYSDEELEAIVKAAKIKGTYVAAHAHSAKAIKQCFKTGIRTIEHASLIDEEGINLALKSKDTFLVTTMTAFAVPSPETSDVANEMNEKIKKFTDQFMISMQNAYDAGIKMGFGTDQGVEGTFHGENANEFIYRKELFNMNNLDILKQATLYNAKIARIDDHVGILDIGFDADIVLLSDNPITNIYACKDNIHCVIKSGKIVK